MAEIYSNMDDSALMDRVRNLEQRGKYLLENSTKPPVFERPNSLRKALSSNNLVIETGLSKTDAMPNFDLSANDEKRTNFSSSFMINHMPTLPLSTSRRFFRTSSLSNGFVNDGVSPQPPGENSRITHMASTPPDVLHSLQQELSQLAIQRDEERAKLTSALNQMRSNADHMRAEYERRLLEKEEGLSRLEYNYEMSNRRVRQLEEELLVSHDALTTQEREVDRLRSEMSMHTNAANQLRSLLNEVSEKLQLGNQSSDDIFSVPPLPPPSCQSVMVLTHSISACIRSAWDQAASARNHCDRLSTEIASIKMECARTIERMESERARTIAAIQAEAEHALKLGQQRLSAAQDRLRLLEDQFEITKEDLTKQLSAKESQIENMRAEMYQWRENEEKERADAIYRATEAERLLSESEANRLRAAALASDADARARQLELELDEIKRRYNHLETELAGEHEKLCRIWHADGNRSSQIRESESREFQLRKKITELEELMKTKSTELEQSVTDFRAKNERLEQDLQVSREQISALSTELENSLECMANYRDQLEKMTKIAHENDRYRHDASSVVKMLEEVSSKCVSLESAKIRVEHELEAARMEMDQLRKDSIASRLAAAESVKAAQLLAKRHRELETQAKEESSKLREEVDRLLTSLAEQEARLSTFAAEKKQLEAASGCQQSEQLTAMRALAKKLANAEKQLVMMQAKSREPTQRHDMDALPTKLKICEERLHDALIDLGEANKLRKDAEKRANEATVLVQKLKERLDAEKSRVVCLHREAAKFHADANKCRLQLEAAGKYVNQLETELLRRAKSALHVSKQHEGKTMSLKSLLSVLTEKADKDESSENERKDSKSRRRRPRSRKHHRSSDNLSKQLVLSPKIVSPNFFETGNKMVVPTMPKGGSQISVSTST